MGTKKSRTWRLTWFLLAAWLIIGLDRVAKLLVLANLQPGQSVSVWGDLLRFVLVFNDSAAFSLGFGITWIFTIISSLAALGILWLAPKLETSGWAIIGGVALGGVVGNLIDRLTRPPGFGVGHVIDFISIPFNFPIFNVADMAIVGVACAVVIRVFRGHKIGKAPTN